MISELTCANCGAAIDPASIRGDRVVCGYCGIAFRVPASYTPEPDLGDLLLGADFRDPAVPGWIIASPDNVEFRPGSPAEVWVSLPASDLIHAVVRTPGPFDDFDAGVTIRFISGVHDQVSAGLEVRSWDHGDYIIRISAQGTFNIGWHDKSAWGDNLVPWSNHPALRAEWGDANRLRVVMRGDRLRVYFNGVLAAAMRDDRFAMGRIRVVLAPGKGGDAIAAFSDVQIRAAPRQP